MAKRAFIDNDTFDHWDKENVWALGLFTADGYSGNKSRPNEFTLVNSDFHLLEKFRNVFKSNKDVYFIDKSKVESHGNKVVGRLILSSNKITSFFRLINAYGTKDQRNPFPSIPNELKWHFIRGLFDGDGSSYANVKKHMLSITLAGRKEILEDLNGWICKELNIPIRNLHKCSNTDITKVLSFSQKAVVRIIYEHMYKDHDGFLSYKKFAKLKFQIKDS